MVQLSRKPNPRLETGGTTAPQCVSRKPGLGRFLYLFGPVLLLSSCLWFLPVACSENNSPSAPVTVTQPITILSTATFTPTGSATPTFTITLSPTSTWTPVTILVTASYTFTFTPTISFTPTLTPTETPSNTPTQTFTRTCTFTPTTTFTNTNTPNMTPCATKSFFGKNGVGGSTSIHSNYICGSRYTLGERGVFWDLSIYLPNNIGGNVCMAIYSSVPSRTLIVQTGSQAAVKGWNKAPLTAPVFLPPGDYWLVYQADVAAAVWDAGGAYSGFTAAYTYGPFPATIPPYGPTSDNFSIYGDYCPSP